MNPTIRFAAPVYPQGRMCLLCGSATVGAVFPPVGTPPNKWAWRVWVTANGFARDGSAKSEQAALQAPPFQPEHEARARAVADFLRAHDAWAGGEFVTLTIDGTTFVVVDIGMRMLTPRELFNAQGFPADYQIDGHWTEADGDWHWKAFPKDVQVSCCGNSVCPDLAAALVTANCAHLMKQSRAA